MTEVPISESTRPKGAVQLTVESVKMPRTMAQIFKFEGPFKHLLERALNPNDQHAGMAGDESAAQVLVSPTRSVTSSFPGVPAPQSKGE